MDAAPRAGHPFETAPVPSLRERLEDAGPAAMALLPVRFFFGLTFLYAGVDKFLDPTFFDANAPSSIVAQLAAFARTSPLAPMLKSSEPFAIPIGLLIAIAEIAIGLGALSGLAFRLAAAGGAVLSLLFFLTASWSTHPYYFGADLPYAFGWLALAIAGDSGLLVARVVRDLGDAATTLPWGERVASTAAASGFRPPRYLGDEPSPSRRWVIQTGALAAAAVAVAAVALPVRMLRTVGTTRASDTGTGDGGLGSGLTPDASSDATAASSAPASSAPASTPVPGGPTSAPQASAATGFQPSGLTVATTAQVDAKGALRIRIPTNAPSSLPAGDPALIVKLKDGHYACFDTVCTHNGCRVGWDAADGVMLCPCHGAAFDPNNHAAVLQGPTNQPLLELPISGAITLKA